MKIKKDYKEHHKNTRHWIKRKNNNLSLDEYLFMLGLFETDQITNFPNFGKYDDWFEEWTRE